MIKFSLVKSILLLKMLKYVSMALASRMICVYAYCLRFLLCLAYRFPHPVLGTFVCSFK